MCYLLSRYCINGRVKPKYRTDEVTATNTNTTIAGTPRARPKGARGKSKLDGREDDIRTSLTKGISKASITRITEVSPPTLDHFVRTRKLQARTASPR